MASAAADTDRVTTLELFFDLVFVFTITQLTAVLDHAPTLRSLCQVILMLGIIWWMYGGYAWMTNAVAATTAARRLLLLGGMAGYLIVALAVPEAFAGSGLAFGLAYLVVVGVHTTLFSRSSSAGVTRAILRLTPYNLSAAAVIVLGGAVGGRLQYVLWAFAVLFEWLTPLVRRPSGFAIAPGHFVERHGLVILVALGESVVAIGIGASHLPIDPGLVAVAALALGLSACLWWLYFGGDDVRAERALAEMPPVRRAQGALRGFGYWHLPMLLGIVMTAAGERVAIAHPFAAPESALAVMLSSGVAVFLLGDVLFRRELGIGHGEVRAVAAALAAATIPLGTQLNAAAQIGALVCLLLVAFAVEGQRPA
jgi:low temperature requirement protein LtrA